MHTRWICLLHNMELGPQSGKMYSLLPGCSNSLPNLCVVGWACGHPPAFPTEARVTHGGGFLKKRWCCLQTKREEMTPFSTPLESISNQTMKAQGSQSVAKWALHPAQPCLQNPPSPASAQIPLPEKMWVTSSLGSKNISLQYPPLNSSTTTMLKANTFSFFLVLRWWRFVVVDFFFIFKRHWFMLNCIEIILLSQHCQSPFLSQSPTSIKLLAPCLLIFSFRNQEISESGGQAEVIPTEMWAQPEAGSTVRPQLHPKTTSALIQNSDFLFHTLILLLHQRSSKNFPDKNKRQERSKGIWWCWGQRMQSSFLQCRKEMLCSELMQLKMQIQTDPKSSQMHVRLAKAKGSWKGWLTKGSLTTALAIFLN